MLFIVILWKRSDGALYVILLDQLYRWPLHEHEPSLVDGKLSSVKVALSMVDSPL